MFAGGATKNILRTFKEAREKKTVLQKIRDYRRFIEIEHEGSDFVVTTAAHGPALLKVLELRHEVFIEEWQGRSAFHGLDVDHHDFFADHLMIVDKCRKKVIGTYRLLSSHFTHDFYSAGEFHLANFLRLPATKLEMGRACIHPNYRDGRVIDLLWKGLALYIEATRTNFLFGCTSLKTTSALEISRLLRTLVDQKAWSDEYSVRPTAAFDFPAIDLQGASVLSAAEKRSFFPPLLRSYLHAGAKVYGLPALDLDFQCTDILTILDWNQLNPRFAARFGV